MKIAFLGWGSLIWDESREFKIDGVWKKDGPKLPIEFARISNDGRLTLVIYPGAQLIEVLWGNANTEDLCEARYKLKEREGTSLDKIEYVSLGNDDKKCNVAPEILDRIRSWASTKKLDAVVWTGLSSNFKEKTKKEYNEDTAIEYLKGLKNADKQNAKEYIQKAPSQVRTKIRERVEQELGWKQ